MNSGIILIDKPLGISSFQAVNKVRRKAGIKKAGHTGTLDPMATGLLTVCLGRATRMARFLTDARKTYQGTITLGVETDSFDAHGKITSKGQVPKGLGLEELQRLALEFVGTIEQSPPAFSAAKHKGVPLYKLARKGITIQKEPRQIEVYRFSIDAYDPPHLSFIIECSKGTYIRSLAHDLGRRLGCGAHLSSLRRTKNGHLSVDQAVGLEFFLNASHGPGLERWILPVEFVLSHIPAIVVEPEQALAIQHGQGMSLEAALDYLDEQKPRLDTSNPRYMRILTTGEDGSYRLVCMASWPVRPCDVSDDDRLEILRVWNPN